LSLSSPQRAMVIIAHPDDAEFLCGGMLALWCAAGTEVTYLILTNGNKGSDDPVMTPEKLTILRREEQHAAADVLGVKNILYLGETDGELQPTLDLRKRVVIELRPYRPEVVITFHPRTYFSRRHINHADHRAAGEIAIDAIYPAARNRMYHPELLADGFEPHMVKEVYLMLTEQPNRWVDITEVMDTKLEALLRHKSQFKQPDEITAYIRERDKTIDQYGREVYHETFKVMQIG